MHRKDSNTFHCYEHLISSGHHCFSQYWETLEIGYPTNQVTMNIWRESILDFDKRKQMLNNLVTSEFKKYLIVDFSWNIWLCEVYHNQHTNLSATIIICQTLSTTLSNRIPMLVIIIWNRITGIVVVINVCMGKYDRLFQG